MPGVQRKIALLNHIGGGNLGDDATLDVIIDNIRSRWPEAILTGFTQNPDDTSRRHNIDSYPIRTRTWTFGYQPATSRAGLTQKVKTLAGKYNLIYRTLKVLNATLIRLPTTCWGELKFVLRSFAIIKNFDLLIVAGGGQLTEWGGPWAFPYTLFKWTALAKVAGVRCVVLNVGAGPLTRHLSRLFVKRALVTADYVSFRDGQSQLLAREIGFSSDARVLPDSVYSLDCSSFSVSITSNQQGRVVGMAPMPYCDPRVDPAEKNHMVYEKFIQTSAAFAAWLTNNSYLLNLFGTDIGVDPLAIEDLEKAILINHGVTVAHYAPIDSLQGLLARIAAMDYIVTCRFHGIIFAHLLNKPVLAIAHHSKVTTLMRDLKLSDYCVDIRSCDPTMLIKKFTSLISNADAIKRSMATSLAKYRCQLAGQFDELFPRDGFAYARVTGG